MARVVILGCYHEIQPARIEEHSAHATAHGALRELIEQVIADHRVDLIAEEWDQPSHTIASSLCDKYSIRYSRIDVPSTIKSEIYHVSSVKVLNEEAGRWEDNPTHSEYQMAWRLVASITCIGHLSILQPTAIYHYSFVADGI